MWRHRSTPTLPNQICGSSQKYWGFSVLVLDWESFLDKIQIDKLQNASYEYLIWKAGHEGEHVVIAQGDTPVGGDCYEVACAVPNDTWYFEIRPKAGWITPTILAFEVIILFVLPALIALGYWQTALRRYKDTVHATELEQSAREAPALKAARPRGNRRPRTCGSWWNPCRPSLTRWPRKSTSRQSPPYILSTPMCSATARRCAKFS